MRKVIAAINMTIDGFCDHTAVNPDEEIHYHYTNLLNEAGVILYGRKTFELMKFWQPFLQQPSGERSMDDFAIAINKVPKIIFSNTMKRSGQTDTGWSTATLAQNDLKEEVLSLRNLPGKDIFVGSPGIIVSLTNLNLIDEYQLCIHPVVAGSGLPLFRNLKNGFPMKLDKSKFFKSGAVILYYTRESE